MKKILLLTIFTLFITSYSHARAKIPVCIPCEKLHEVQDLPNDEALLESGSYLNLGYLYNEYGAVFIPVWNTSGRYVLINEAKTVYYDLTEEQLLAYKEAYKLDLPSNPLSFWKKIGGKLIFLIIIGFILYGKFGKDPEEEEGETPPQEEATKSEA